MLNDKQKEICLEEAKEERKMFHDFNPTTNTPVFILTLKAKEVFAEKILAAQTVSFPEPSEEDKNTFSYKISGELLRKINEASYLSDETEDEIPMHVIEFVLLAYAKLMNEGKV